MVLVFVDLKIRLYLGEKTSTVVYKIKTLAKLRDPQNCVQMLLFCLTTNHVMEIAPRTLTKFNVQEILIIALTHLSMGLGVMAGSGVKNTALAT